MGEDRVLLLEITMLLTYSWLVNGMMDRGKDKGTDGWVDGWTDKWMN